ncbi:hypothetical protein BGX38DRAFT_1196070 [Terfezia claveryi]|nr:hypothetical protein BGX38DRAFT_1196070 [Terfezia claveryi]
MAWEYKEEDRLDAKVARAFHKHIGLERYISSTTVVSASAASAASAAPTAAPTIPTIIQLNTPLTSITAATIIAQSYPLVVESKKIIVDDKMIMVYWRKGLELPFGRIQSAQMRTKVEEAIEDLANVFPSPRPKVSDVRHQHFEEALRKHGSGNCGVYHFARWVAIGQRGVRDPVLSRDLLSTGAHFNAACDFHTKIAPLIQTISLLFQAVDPPMHLHYLKQYRYVLLFFVIVQKLIL